MLLTIPPVLVIEPQIEEDPVLLRRLRHREEQRQWRLKNPEKDQLSRKIWLEKHPEFKREYNKKWSSRNPDKIRGYRRSYKLNHRDKVNAAHHRYYLRKRSIKAISQTPNEILKRVYASLSSGLPRFIRDDVAGEMLLAVLEGKLLVENIARSVGEFTKKYNRQFDTFKTLSLDAPIAGTDLRRIDLLVAE